MRSALPIAFAVLTASSVAHGDPSRAAGTVYGGATVEGLAFPTPVRGLGGRVGVVLDPDLAVELAAVHEWDPLVFGNDTATLSETVVDASIVAFPTHGTFFFRGGLGYARVAATASLHDDEDHFEGSFHAVGALLSVGNRWDGKLGFFSIEWVGARAWVPFAETYRSNFAYRGVGSVAAEVRLLSLTLGVSP